MENILKIGLVQMSMSMNVDENSAKAVVKIKEAVGKGAEIVCLPELFLLQYFPKSENEKNFELSDVFPNKATNKLSEMAKDNQITIIGGSFFEKDGSNFFNTCIVFNSEGILGKYRKVHIPNDDYFHEKKYFTPGNGYKVYDVGKCKVGTLICYDQWFPEAARENKLMGADILFYPTAIGWFEEFKKEEPFSIKRWVRDQCSHASMNNMFVVAVNRVGNEEDLDFWGNSFVADPYGNVIVQAGEEEEVIVVDIDLDLIKQSEGWGFMKNRRPDTYGDISK